MSSIFAVDSSVLATCNIVPRTPLSKKLVSEELDGTLTPRSVEEERDLAALVSSMCRVARGRTHVAASTLRQLMPCVLHIPCVMHTRVPHAHVLHIPVYCTRHEPRAATAAQSEAEPEPELQVRR